MPAGFLYVAHCHDGTNRLKVGQTANLNERKYGWAGSTDTKFTLVFSTSLSLPAAAEAYAHSLLDSWGCRPKGARKELFSATVDQAKLACEKATLAYADKVPPAPPSLLAAELVAPLTSDDPDIATVLRFTVRHQREQVTLGALLALSLVERGLESKLLRLGIVCTYQRKDYPEFRFQLDGNPRLQEWANASGIIRNQLQGRLRFHA